MGEVARLDDGAAQGARMTVPCSIFAVPGAEMSIGVVQVAKLSDVSLY